MAAVWLARGRAGGRRARARRTSTPRARRRARPRRTGRPRRARPAWAASSTPSPRSSAADAGSATRRRPRSSWRPWRGTVARRGRPGYEGTVACTTTDGGSCSTRRAGRRRGRRARPGHPPADGRRRLPRGDRSRRRRPRHRRRRAPWPRHRGAHRRGVPERPPHRGRRRAALAGPGSTSSSTTRCPPTTAASASARPPSPPSRRCAARPFTSADRALGGRRVDMNARDGREETGGVSESRVAAAAEVRRCGAAAHAPLGPPSRPSSSRSGGRSR